MISLNLLVGSDAEDPIGNLLSNRRRPARGGGIMGSSGRRKGRWG